MMKYSHGLGGRLMRASSPTVKRLYTSVDWFQNSGGNFDGHAERTQLWRKRPLRTGLYQLVNDSARRGRRNGPAAEPAPGTPGGSLADGRYPFTRQTASAREPALC